ncbi:MAG TPA: outer membrane beta-barrel protein [Xanthobacteraceae bacterium]|jgi:outer membrane immunogenic protein
MRLGITSGLLAAALIASAPAFAADMPVKAAPMVGTPTWTGTYIGINGGWGRGTTNHTDTFGTSTNDFSQSGGLAGITYGGNWQSGRWVLGFESDLDWADIKGTLTTAGPPLGLCSVAGGTTCFTNINTFSTERMRAGVDVDGWLLYATGGVAFARVDAGQNPCGPIPANPRLGVGGGNSCNEKWRTGWVVGAGVEKMFAPHWSVKLEYLHFDLGDDIQYLPTSLPIGASAVRVLERGDMVRLGINYQFDFLSLLHLN